MRIEALKVFLAARAHTSKPESGFSMAEVLVSIILIGITAVSVVLGLTIAQRTYKSSSIHQYALMLAKDKIEVAAANKPSSLDDSFDSNEPAVTVSGTNVTFTRVVDVTVNPDNSRTVKVTVSSNHNFLPITVQLIDTFG